MPIRWTPPQARRLKCNGRRYVFILHASKLIISLFSSEREVVAASTLECILYRLKDISARAVYRIRVFIHHVLVSFAATVVARRAQNSSQLILQCAQEFEDHVHWTRRHLDQDRRSVPQSPFG